MSEQTQTATRPARAERYDPQTIERKWQERWERDGIYVSKEDASKPKFYCLDFFPYPSGDGLSVGHCRNYVPTDAISRYMRMRGYSVLHPMGWDAFGLPAENEAILRGRHPKVTVPQYTANYKRQLQLIGTSYDWTREVNSSAPDYYRWTQWFFLFLYDRGLAYRSTAPANWCPKDGTVLANEEVIDGACWRCGTPIVKKSLPQWFFKITAYADRLLEDLSTIDWPEKIILMQENWIGRSEGAELGFRLEAAGADEKEIRVFTTRPDTVYGVTFMVLAPEHPLVERITTPEQRDAVRAYVEQAERETEIERLSAEREKTGVFTGAYVTNPFNGERVPVWVADYVLATYGSGAVMGVPAHDERDFHFALKYGMPILPVIERPDGLSKAFAMKGTMREGYAEALRAEGIPFDDRGGSLFVTIPKERVDRYIAIAQAHLLAGSWHEIVGTRWVFIFDDGVEEWDSLEAERRILARCKQLESAVKDVRTLMEMEWNLPFHRDLLFHDEYGTMIHSGPLSGTPGDQAVAATVKHAEEHGYGRHAVTYRLRDWLISRQRYWGAPIPIIYCDACGEVPVPESDLPVLLPDVDEYEPSGTGRSPLANVPEFLNTTCPRCGGRAERETDTMGGFACSSWYFLRFTSPHYAGGPFEPEAMRYWMPVDVYVGGAEHAVMHLLYARFWMKVAFDAELVHFNEPFKKLMNQGIVHAPDGKRMSKSRGNVITPDSVVERHGADSLRGYELFMAPFEQNVNWSDEGVRGINRWLHRVWSLVRDAAPAAGDGDVRELRRWTHKTLRRVTQDMERFHFNTMLAALMEYTNYLTKLRESGDAVDAAAWREAMESLVLMLAPGVPYVAEELWERMGRPYSVHQQAWPSYAAALAAEDEVEIAVQVNGRLRDRLTLSVGAPEAQAREAAMASAAVAKHVGGKEIARVIYVPDRLLNIVVKG